ncbi:MAG: WD40 domain-containing protein [Candidatus Acetothermia bacterium]|jgi:WD40 repeat protein|nr:WD40 domain-containing protein [Candidatus Acetothermia bacterium]
MVLWDPGTGLELRALTGHTELVTTVAWSPDGMLLATGSEDGMVMLWDVSDLLDR